MTTVEGGGVDDDAGRHRHRGPDTGPLPAPAPAPGKRQPVVRARRFPTGFSSLRDLLSFIAGVAIIGNEVFLSDRVEVAFLTVGVTLTGLPIVFGADEKKP